MKPIAGIFLILSIFTSACALTEPAPEYTAVPAYLDTPSIVDQPKEIQTPPFHADWQIQYSGEMDYSLDVDVFNLDLVETKTSDIEQLRERGIYVMCYFSAGSYEDWRPDAAQFPQETLGRDMEGWPGEKWLDIRQIHSLAPIMESRLDLAKDKGCNGVDPDNINGYVNDTGFPLTYQDQINFNAYLSEQAHKRGLAIGLKNDLEQIPDLLTHFDWALNEECFSYDECQLLLPFTEAGKPVFIVEYQMDAEEFCTQAKTMNFNAIQKHLELDSFLSACG